jgi:hypothetical protein
MGPGRPNEEGTDVQVLESCLDVQIRYMTSVIVWWMNPASNLGRPIDIKK